MKLAAPPHAVFPLLRENLPGLLGALALSLLMLAVPTDETLPAGAAPLMVGAFLLALLFGTRLVQPDFARGTLAFWIQKPGSVHLLYLERLAVAMGVGVGCFAALAAVVGAVGPPGSWATVVETTPRLAVLMVVTVSVAFGFSAAGVGREAVPTVVVVLIVGTLASDAAVAPELFGWAATPLRVLGFPIHKLELLGHLDGHGWMAGWPGAIAHMLLYGLVWIGLGMAALATRLGRPLVL